MLGFRSQNNQWNDECLGTMTFYSHAIAQIRFLVFGEKNTQDVFGFKNNLV